ncbi:MAG: hypothetical protein MUE40_20785 [Anaerolineae bacterium]|jgi:hypothetical protein|nr:hypothetical protein [Anaerolineae bacterium]
MIVVEVKCFPENRSLLDDFYQAIGQYQVYRNALKSLQPSMPLYLAIPHSVYDILLQNEVIRATLEEIRLKLVIVNLEKEEVALWQP